MENQVKIDADHSNICRFDLSIERDQDNYKMVQANIEDLCEVDFLMQGELSAHSPTSVPRLSPAVLNHLRAAERFIPATDLGLNGEFDLRGVFLYLQRFYRSIDPLQSHLRRPCVAFRALHKQ